MKKYFKEILSKASAASSKRFCSLFCLVLAGLIVIYSMIAMGCRLNINTSYCLETVITLLTASGAFQGLTLFSKKS